MAQVAPGLGPVLESETPKARISIGRPQWYVADTFTLGDFPLSAGVKLGGSAYAIPKGAEHALDFDPATGIRTCVVLLSDGSIHVLTEAGELFGLPAKVLDGLRVKHFRGR